jgi:Flp pilus assembly protein TadD
VWEFSSTAERILQLRHVVRRETVRLVILTTVASAAFVGTRALAQRAEHLAVKDAAAWYARGQQLLAEADAEAAAVAFRRATMKHRGEKPYVLALADALVQGGSPDPAIRALAGLREQNPEDVDVNLALARLARSRGDRTEAVRYYQHAIYAPVAEAGSARTLRLELVEFLLESGQPERANSELVAASLNVPDDPSVRLDLADLFLRAGNATRAAEQYQLVLERDPTNLGALEGAVAAAFALADYRRVAQYRLPDTASSDAVAQVAIARAVLSRDPLANRLPAAERRRRLVLNVTYIEERWRECRTARGQSADYPASLIELRAATRRTGIGRDNEALEAGLVTLDRLRQELEQLCDTVTPIDRALAIITRSHDLGV